MKRILKKALIFWSGFGIISMLTFGEMSELVEGARLEIVYTATTVSGVRIPVSPPRKDHICLLDECGLFLNESVYLAAR